MVDDEVTAGVSALSLSAPLPRNAGAVDPPSDASDELQPYFNPPLWLGRRTAIVQTLRREGVHSVVELGCGPGVLLQILCLPANSLDDFPTLLPPSPYSTSPSDSFDGGPSARARKLDVLRSVPSPPGEERELHLSRLVGVDIDRASLDNAIKITAATVKEAEEEGERKWGGVQRERWEDLRIEVWEGALETYNEAFDGVDAMVAAEVIEHLSDHALDKFVDIVFGVYQPRIVVVTTPNHDFNPWFVSSSAEEEATNRFPDPTRRTTRVLRDSDHKFEWTQAEFEAWAKRAAQAENYRVSFSGVGSLRGYYGRSPIPFPPPSLDAHPALATAPTSLAIPTDPTRFYATQVATFTRSYSNEPERSPRSHQTTPLPFFSPSSIASPTTNPFSNAAPASSPTPPAQTPHALLKSTTHRAVPAAGNPSPPALIRKEVARLFYDFWERRKVALRDVWSQRAVRSACGGVVGTLVDALVESDEWDFEVTDEGKAGDLATELVWLGWKERERGEEEGGTEEEKEERMSDGGGEYVEYAGGVVEPSHWGEEDDVDWDGVRVDRVVSPVLAENVW